VNFVGGCGGQKWQNQVESRLGTQRNQTWRSFCIFACFFYFKITPQNPYPSNQDFNFYLGIAESLLPFLSPFFLSLSTNCTIATNFFFFFDKTQHSNIKQNWVAKEQKWVSFSLFADECGRTKMGFSSFLGF
jgi:hypothetical protein